MLYLEWYVKAVNSNTREIHQKLNEDDVGIFRMQDADAGHGKQDKDWNANEACGIHRKIRFRIYNEILTQSPRSHYPMY